MVFASTLDELLLASSLAAPLFAPQAATFASCRASAACQQRRAARAVNAPAPSAPRRQCGPPTSGPAPQPHFRVLQREGGVLLVAELPGVRQQDVSIRVQGRLLRVQARAPARRHYVRDPWTGAVFVREVTPAEPAVDQTFRLGQGINVAGISADIEDGLLTGEPCCHRGGREEAGALCPAPRKCHGGGCATGSCFLSQPEAACCTETSMEVARPSPAAAAAASEQAVTTESAAAPTQPVPAATEPAPANPAPAEPTAVAPAPTAAELAATEPFASPELQQEGKEQQGEREEKGKAPTTAEHLAMFHAAAAAVAKSRSASSSDDDEEGVQVEGADLFD
eukprot:scaffold7.g3677.t1